MEPVFAFMLIIAFIACIIALRLFAGSLDRSRITEYLSSQGAQVDEIVWSPFGRGWLGSKNERIYEVTYTDATGMRHQATCKTSMFAGVYFTENPPKDMRVAGPQDTRAKYEAWRRLQDENQRLRAELDQLKRTRQE